MNYEVKALDQEVQYFEEFKGAPLTEREYFYYVRAYLTAYFNELGTE